MCGMTRFLLQSLRGVPRLSATVPEEWTRRCLRSLPVLLWIFMISWISIPILDLYNWHLQWVIHWPLSVDDTALKESCGFLDSVPAKQLCLQVPTRVRTQVKGFTHTFADVPQPPSVSLPNGYCSTQCNSHSTFLVSFISLRIHSFSCSDIYKQTVWDTYFEFRGMRIKSHPLP